MKLRRIISFLLLAVYLTMAAGPALRSLSCECVAMGAHVRHEHHDVGCSHSGCPRACCAGASDGASAPVCVAAPCCDDRHSTEIELYTGLDSETERPVRCAVVHLPASLAVECPCPAHVPALRHNAVARTVPLPAGPASGIPGLRAPPVLV